MKKLITLALCAVMLASLFAVSSSAAGSILFEDDFSDGFTNTDNWRLEGNLFFGDDMSEPGNICLSGYADAVVSQMEYDPERTNSGAKIYKDCVMSIDVCLRDFDRDGTHEAMFWWRDNFLFVPDGEEAPEGYEQGPVYNCGVNFDDNIFFLRRDDMDGNLFEVPVTGISSDDGWFNIGWRIVAGKMECYLNSEKLIEYTSGDLLSALGSPVLLVNINNFVSFDNLVIATADYDLFNEGTVDTTAPVTDAPVVDDTNADTDAPVVDDTNADTDAPVVDDTNADTNAPAVDDTNAPAVDNTDAPAADTVGTTGTQKPSTSTGDASFVVVAAMVAALGSALIVKRVRG